MRSHATQRHPVSDTGLIRPNEILDPALRLAPARQVPSSSSIGRSEFVISWLWQGDIPGLWLVRLALFSPLIGWWGPVTRAGVLCHNDSTVCCDGWCLNSLVACYNSSHSHHCSIIALFHHLTFTWCKNMKVAMHNELLSARKKYLLASDILSADGLEVNKHQFSPQALWYSLANIWR